MNDVNVWFGAGSMTQLAHKLASPVHSGVICCRLGADRDVCRVEFGIVEAGITLGRLADWLN